MVSYGVADMTGPRKSTLRALGTLASFGWPHPLSLLTSSRGIIGINMLRIADERRDIIQRCLNAVVPLAAAGKLRPEVGKVFAAAQLAEAHDFLGSRQSVGKTVIQW